MTIIFDIDGTLSDNTHRQHYVATAPKDWDAFYSLMHLDPPHEDVADLLRMFEGHWFKIVLATGRDEKHRDATVTWLRQHNIPFDKLYMRPAGDRRDDGVVKIEMLAQMRTDGFDPKMVFDDRDRVVKAWRDAGLRCFQVAEGAF